MAMGSLLGTMYSTTRGTPVSIVQGPLFRLILTMAHLRITEFRVLCSGPLKAVYKGI